MLRSRIIPCLLIHKNGLVKTINFKDPKYVGDPINAVKIFNEKEVDELIVLDIDATRENRAPNFKMIKNLADECRMPFWATKDKPKRRPLPAHQTSPQQKQSTDYPSDCTCTWR